MTFAATPPLARAIPVAFDASGSSDSDGTIVSYDWDFGDGGTGTGVNPSHTFAAAGSYLVELTVVDDDGLSDLKNYYVPIEERSDFVVPEPRVIVGLFACFSSLGLFFLHKRKRL